MTKAPYVCDLHSHTTLSDGYDTPEELIRHAAERGLMVVAITDHDRRPPVSVCVNGVEKDLVEFGEGLGVHVIRGIEISCETDVDDVHIIGLGCDWSDSWFDELDAFTQRSKVKGYQLLIKILTKKGMPITWEEITANNGAPLRDEEVQKKYIFEMMAQKGYRETWKDAKLLVKNDPALNIRREKPDAAETIRNIRRLGGIAILAHPYLINECIEKDGRKMPRKAFIDDLIDAGLDGIEARYTYNKTSYIGYMTPDEICREVNALYRDRGLILSGGSDYHADYRKSARNNRELGECGLTLEEFWQYGKLRNL